MIPIKKVKKFSNRHIYPSKKKRQLPLVNQSFRKSVNLRDIPSFPRRCYLKMHSEKEGKQSNRKCGTTSTHTHKDSFCTKNDIDNDKGVQRSRETRRTKTRARRIIKCKEERWKKKQLNDLRDKSCPETIINVVWGAERQMTPVSMR